jgi:hypothetical protein
MKRERRSGVEKADFRASPVLAFLSGAVRR